METCSVYRTLKTEVVMVEVLFRPRKVVNALTRTINMGVFIVFVTRCVAPAIDDLVDILSGLPR